MQLSCTLPRKKVLNLVFNFRAKKDPLEKIYARLAAEDMIPINRLAESYDIKRLLRLEDHKPFDSHVSVAK